MAAAVPTVNSAATADAVAAVPAVRSAAVAGAPEPAAAAVAGVAPAALAAIDAAVTTAVPVRVADPTPQRRIARQVAISMDLMGSPRRTR